MAIPKSGTLFCKLVGIQSNMPVQGKFFQPAMTFFKLCGLWRTDGGSKLLEPYVFISRFNVYFFFGWAFIASLASGCYLYYLNGEIDRALDWGTFGFAYVIMQFKFITLATNELRIRNIIRKLEKFASRYSDKTNVSRSLLFARNLTIAGSLMIGGACLGYCGFFIMMNTKRTLPIKTIFTFGMDIYESPIYEIYIVYEMIGTLVHTVPSTVFDMTYVGFLLVAAAILKDLNMEFKRKLIHIRVYCPPDEKHKMLLVLIRDHIEIFDFLNEVRELFTVFNMLHFFCYYFCAGLTLFQVSKQQIGSVRFFSMISGCSSSAFELITFCEAGQQVSNEMEQFWLNLYATDWFKQPTQFRKTVAYALHCTQKEYFMKAGMTMTLSRETEKRIIQAIFTYYTFLLRMSS